MTARYALTDGVATDVATATRSRAEAVERQHQWLQARWSGRYRVFDWLSKMRTVLGSSLMPDRSLAERASAFQRVASGVGLTPDQMRADARSTLLVIWTEWTDRRSTFTRCQAPLLELLRQEIEYSIHYIETLGGSRVDPLDEFWSPSAASGAAARLIDALPREEDLARRDFPWQAEPYLRKQRVALEPLSKLDRGALRSLIEQNWTRSRALRRFVLAFERLHKELHGQRLTAEEGLIRQTERIEQFNLAVMHAERVMSLETRERGRRQGHSDVRPLVRECLNHVLGRWGLLSRGFSRVVQRRVAELMTRAQLHDLEEASRLPLVDVQEVRSGNGAADQLIAAYVNFLIARNYAAHHDVFDFELVYPGGEKGAKHQGATALESVMLVVVTTLMTR